MKCKLQRSAACMTIVALLLCLTVGAVPAQTNETRYIAAEKLDEASKEASQAAEVLREIMAVPDKAIPQELLDRAEAIGVFPNVLKVAFFIGGRGGDGVISRRTAAGWSVPAFFNLRGGSYGTQIGVSSTDVVLLFMNQGALQGLLEDTFEFGGQASIAAGPEGRTVRAATNLSLDAGILSYSRSEGLFAGIALHGAVVTPDNVLNEALYGMQARDILTGEKKMTTAQIPPEVRIFPQTLARHTLQQTQSSGARVRQ